MIILIKRIILSFVLVSSYAFAMTSDLNKIATESAVQALSKEFSSGSILSVPLAELALNKLEQLQTTLQVELQEKETACLDHFFTNACLQELRLKRRELQAILRNIRIEAKSFLRGTRANKSQNLVEQN